ncbi:MraY family glycosyltransferase [Maribacter aestuarii]|uniref:MraY family glycosyltransferase n=1 Tax=Maribacter aestuarii TaxID=1130723 RepID=UPI0025A6822A|nr:MraY family glycosyltransferase [Maribacter aestuarii]
MTYISNVFNNLYVLSGIAVLAAYLFSARIYPVIIHLSHKKDLMDEPGERSMHLDKTPTLGGVGLFITFALGIILMSIFTELERSDLVKVLALVGSTILLLFLGLKDDLLVISPKKKFSGQLLASAIVVFASDLRILGMDGVFGVGELPYWISVLFTIFVFILIINAFNLIDGIDGLAGGIGILTSAFFGLYFALNGNAFMALASFLLIGALIGFLVHNFSKEQKLFMGDSGSLFTGFIMAYLAVAFLNLNFLGENLEFPLENAPIIAIAVLSYPMMDVLRVFIIRIREGRSPFSADRNHIHHRFLDLGSSHKMASLTIAVTNLTVIAFALVTQNLYIHFQLFCCLVFGIALYLIPFMLNANKNLEAMEVPLSNEALEVEFEGMYAKARHLNKTVSSDNYSIIEKEKKNRPAKILNTATKKQNDTESYFQKKVLHRLRIFQKVKEKYPKKVPQENS